LQLSSKQGTVVNTQAIFAEYIRMRTNGLDTKAVLFTLRTYIEPLSGPARDELVQTIRTWEQNNSRAAAAKPVAGIKPLASAQERDDSPAKIKKVASLQAAPAVEAAEIDELQGKFDTRSLVDASERVNEDFFSKESRLLLQVRGTNQAFEMRPQDFSHEIVIGRSAGDHAMAPDIDLIEQKAAELGVSRLHVALKYDSEHEAIHVYDLGSSNGSYINNQKLNPHEVRFLRDGDALRLGKLVLLCKFTHD
jgi:hypothetical protein